MHGYSRFKIKKRKSESFSAAESNRFLLKGCANGVRAGGRVAGADVYPLGCAVVVAVMINTVGDVARNALIAFAGLTCFFSRIVSTHDCNRYPFRNKTDTSFRLKITNVQKFSAASDGITRLESKTKLSRVILLPSARVYTDIFKEIIIKFSPILE